MSRILIEPRSILRAARRIMDAAIELTEAQRELRSIPRPEMPAATAGQVDRTLASVGAALGTLHVEMHDVSQNLRQRMDWAQESQSGRFPRVFGAFVRFAMSGPFGPGAPGGLGDVSPETMEELPELPGGDWTGVVLNSVAGVIDGKFLPGTGGQQLTHGTRGTSIVEGLDIRAQYLEELQRALGHQLDQGTILFNQRRYQTLQSLYPNRPGMYAEYGRLGQEAEHVRLGGRALRGVSHGLVVYGAYTDFKNSSAGTLQGKAGSVGLSYLMQENPIGAGFNVVSGGGTSAAADFYSVLNESIMTGNDDALERWSDRNAAGENGWLMHSYADMGNEISMNLPDLHIFKADNSGGVHLNVPHVNYKVWTWG